MNKLKILFALVFVVVFTMTASAIEVGQNLTQAQIDGINFDTVNLQCSFDGLQTSIPNGIIQFDFSCLSLIPSGNKYTVIRQNIPEYYLISEYLQCRQSYTRPVCISTVRETILDFFKRDKLSLRAYLKEFQTKTSDILGSDFDFGGDLN